MPQNAPIGAAVRPFSFDGGEVAVQLDAEFAEKRTIHGRNMQIMFLPRLDVAGLLRSAKIMERATGSQGGIVNDGEISPARSVSFKPGGNELAAICHAAILVEEEAGTFLKVQRENAHSLRRGVSRMQCCQR